MKRLLQYVRSLRSQTTGNISFLSNGAFLFLAWIYLPLESLNWQWVRRNRRALFPHVDFDALKPLDPLRMLIQGIFLVFVSHKGLVKTRDERRRTSELRATAGKLHRFWRKHYFGFIERIRSIVQSGASSLTEEETGFWAGLGVLARAFCILLTLAASALALLCITQPLSVENQTIFLIGALLLAYFLREIRSHVTLIFLILLSSIVSA